MNLQNRLQTLGAKYGITDLEGFKSEATNLIACAIADLVHVANQHGFDSDKIKSEMILNTVADVFAIHPEMLKSDVRKKYIVVPRQMAALILYESGFTLQEIGNLLNKHHTTIMYGISAMQDLLGIGLHKKKLLQIKNKLNNPIGIDDGTPAPEDCPL